MAKFRQHDVERAVRAATKAGFIPARINFGPDGSFSLCFGKESEGRDAELDQELEAWKLKDARN